MADKSLNFDSLQVVVEHGTLYISGTAHYSHSMSVVEIAAQDESKQTVTRHVEWLHEHHPVQLEAVDVCAVRDMDGSVNLAGKTGIQNVRRALHFYGHEIGRTVAAWLTEQDFRPWHRAAEEGLVDDEWVSNPDSPWYRG